MRIELRAKGLGRKKPLFYLVAILVLALLAGCTGTAVDTAARQVQDTGTGELTVHFLDVGQADCALVRLPDGTGLLVDGGNAADAEQVIRYLKKQGIQELVLVVATHPHEDHIGGLAAVISAFPVGEFYLPRASTTTRTYERLLSALKDEKIAVKEAKAGVRLDLGSDVQVEFLGPIRSYEELNDQSAVLKLTYGATRFLFMGDAGAEAEKDLVARGGLEADVLKVGHHGSVTGTSAAFVQAVRPHLAVISVGRNNDYGHPDQEVLERLGEAGAEVWRTDLAGTVVATSDGNRVWISTGLAE